MYESVTLPIKEISRDLFFTLTIRLSSETPPINFWVAGHISSGNIEQMGLCFSSDIFNYLGIMLIPFLLKKGKG